MTLVSIHSLRVLCVFARTIHCAAHQSTTVESQSSTMKGGFHAA
jgi:hypothetical protein